MKIAIIDNYDSFTYNLSHLVKELGAEVTVLRNDQFELSESPIRRSSFRQALVFPRRQVCSVMSSALTQDISRSSVSVLVIRPLAKCSVESWRI